MLNLPRLRQKNLQRSLIAIFALLLSTLDLTYGFHWPWDQGHDTTQPNVPPNPPPKSPPCDCDNATGSPVFLASGRYFYTVTDLRIPGQGLSLEVTRTYNSMDRHNGLFGYGWLFSLDTRLVPVSDGTTRFAIVRMPDGSRVSYRQTGPTTFAPPPGGFSSLSKRGDGSYELVEKDGRKQTFNADGYLVALADRYGSQLTLSYTADGFLSAVADRNGRRLQFTLNTNGKVASVTDFTNRIVRYTYDAAGRLTTVVDAAGNTTTYDYNADGNMTRVAVRISPTRTDVLAQITYDGQGRAARVVDAEGDFRYVYAVGETRKIDNSPNPPQRDATWIYRYDSRGIFTEIRDPLGNVERRTYDANGQLVQLTDKSGTVTRYEYDARGNLLKRTDAAGRPEQRVTTFTYEPTFNRKLSESDARGIITTYAYDAQGNLLRRTEAAGLPEQRTTSYEYDAFGNVTRLVYPDGTADRLTYDSAGRLLTRTNALNQTFTFTYDSLSRLQCARDPNLHSTCFEYDAMNRVTAVVDARGVRTERTYDAAGNMLTTTNGLGQVTRYTYDALHHPLTVTDYLGNVTTYTYDLSSRRTSQLDPNGKMTYYKYDALGRLFRVVQKVGETLDRITASDAVTEYVYNAMDKPMSVTDPNGSVTRYDYDGLQRVQRETNPNGQTLTYTYDGADNKVSSQRSDGYVRTFQYDSFRRMVQESDSVGLIATYAYDARDRRTRVTDGNNNVTGYGYDAAGRLTSITDPLGRAIRFEYDGFNNLTRHLDREGHARVFTYDEVNRRLTMTDALSNTTTYGYDAAGRLTSLRDGNGNATTFAYSNAGTHLVTRQTYPDGASLLVELDGAGNLVRRVDPNGAATAYTYDDFHRLLRRAYPDGSADVFTYDKGGRMLTAVNANATIAFTYDAAGRVTQATQNGAALTYAYNTTGTQRTLGYPGGRRVQEVYDGRDRLLSVNNQLPVSNTLAQFTYDLGNRLTSKRLVNNIATDFTYDGNDNVTRLVAQLGGALRVGFEYRFDREDTRLLSKRLHDLSRSERYGYDAVYWLEQYRRGELDASGEIPLPSTQSAWTLDGVGNWSRLVRDGVTETRVHNPLNQVVSVDGRLLRYDANGNLIDDGVSTYAYDFENHLTQVTRRSDGQVLARFRYDALKRRVAKEAGGVTVTYIYDDLRVIEERQNAVTTASFVYGRNETDVLAMQRGGQDYYYHPNSLGTIEAVSDAGGALVERYVYEAYGRVRFFDGAGGELPASAVGNPLLFTAQRWDGEAGLYDYRARQYHPGLGRFLQRDPLGYRDSSNLYQYVGNNPINYLDPLGLAALSLDKIKDLVKDNNLSGQSDQLIICQIWKESSFDPDAAASTSSAKGLMEVTKGAAKDAGYDYSKLSDPALNIQAGSKYLGLRIKWAKGDVTKGLNGYGTGPGYADDILECEKCQKDCQKDDCKKGDCEKKCLEKIHS